jgi:hypothetical protein
MKRLFILGCLCLAFHLPGRGASTTNAAAAPRPVYRFLFLIDTSSAMSRQKEATMDTMSRLILSGIGGRMHSGDAWNLWMVDDQLHTNSIPAQRWNPQQRADVANSMFRFLRAQRFNKKRAPLEKALAAVADEAQLSGTLTVFLFTDGGAPVKGTPFDEPINEIFTKHAAEMRKSKNPFVTVFVAQDGKFFAHAVSPGGERIYIPRPPEAVATAKNFEAAAKEKPADVPPPAARSLTAEEISEMLRQSQKRQSNTVAITPAPLIIRGGASQTNVVPLETSGKTAVETPAQTAVASLPVPDATVSPDRAAPVSKPPPAIAPASPAGTEPSAPARENASAPGNASVPTTPPKNQVPATSTETPADDAREAPAHSPAPAETAVLAQQEPLSNSPLYLLAAVALLLAAAILGWLYIRSMRYVPRPSIISQSLDREKK